MSTAFPQPAPGTAASPGPMKVPAEKLRSVLGLTSVNYVQSSQALAVIDSSLDSAAAASGSVKGGALKQQDEFDDPQQRVAHFDQIAFAELGGLN